MKCPYCLEEIKERATRCPFCAGDIVYESPTDGQTFTSMLLGFLLAWAILYGICYWIGNSFLGGTNQQICFWFSLVLSFSAMFGSKAKKKY